MSLTAKLFCCCEIKALSHDFVTSNRSLWECLLCDDDVNVHDKVRLLINVEMWLRMLQKMEECYGSLTNEAMNMEIGAVGDDKVPLLMARVSLSLMIC